MTDIVDRLRYRLGKGGPGTPCIIGYSDPGTPLEQDVQEAADEIERLRTDLANMYRLHRERGALIDDLAATLTKTLAGSVPGVAFDLSQQPDVRRVMARYRKARQR